MDIPPFELLKDLVDTLMVPLMLFGLKILWNVSKLVQKMHQTLYGETGNNGLRSDVRTLENRSEEHGYRIHALEGMRHGKS